MRTKITSISAALLCAAAASPAFAQARTAPGGPYSLLSGTTVPTGTDVVSGEFGWPSATFGFTHGMSPTSDVGFKFDLLFGFEDTTNSQFGIGFRVPFRFMIHRRDRLSILAHVDPGIKIYTTNPALFGFQWPVGLTVGYAANPDLNVAFGFELPMTLEVTGPGPSPVQMFLGPMFGPAFEYHLPSDRRMTVGFNTRFGPIFSTKGGGGQFAFVTQVLLAYRL
ncbi:MAG TPA: hypothetical protein VKC58_06250 [Myxococcales bacterium]|jgi:hypothetical protein|nr:hypothetical protein [Myxococcales bacterium]